MQALLPLARQKASASDGLSTASARAICFSRRQPVLAIRYNCARTHAFRLLPVVLAAGIGIAGALVWHVFVQSPNKSRMW